MIIVVEITFEQWAYFKLLSLNLCVNPTPVQESKTTAVIFNFWFRVGTRGIYYRGKKTLLYASVINPRHIWIVIASIIIQPRHINY